jgi:haloalkane dehalogenase
MLDDEVRIPRAHHDCLLHDAFDSTEETMRRRDFLLTSAGAAGAALLGCRTERNRTEGTNARVEETKRIDVPTFHASRRFAKTRFGRIAYVERGDGPVVIFFHGLPLNGYQWRGALERLSSQRRCIAPDFMGLGYTEVAADQDLAPGTQAEMISAFLDALSIDTVDLIANDSGGAIAQLFAVRNPKRVRTLLLTNCDVHENSPPALLVPMITAARAGKFADQALIPQLADKAKARLATPTALGGCCYTDPSHLTDEAIDCYLGPLVSSPVRKAQLNRYIAAFEPNPLLAIEPELKRLQVPARMVWGTADTFFPVSWAEWLDRTLPQSRGIRRVEGAKLFFPEEFPDLIAEEVRALWR